MGIFDIFKPKWKHPEPTIRKIAVGQLKNQGILSEIIKNDPDIEIRNVAITTLDKVKTELQNANINRYIQLIKNAGPNSAVYDNTIIPLSQTGIDAIKPILKSVITADKDGSCKNFNFGYHFYYNFMAETLAFLSIREGECAIEIFLKTLKNKNENDTIRAVVLKALGFNGLKKFVEIIIKVLKDENESYRIKSSATEALEWSFDVHNRRLLLFAATLKICDDKLLKNLSNHTIAEKGKIELLKELIQNGEDNSGNTIHYDFLKRIEKLLEDIKKKNSK